jgi:2-phosphosulfolactate phosphatase
MRTRGFDPWPDAQLHVEWGPLGAAMAAERGDMVVIVDVLSFSTTVSIAVDRGATALSYSAAELDAMGGWDAAGERLRAVVIAKDRTVVAGRPSLSPASLGHLRPGDRVVFTSLNGAQCTAAAEGATALFVASLRNRSATAQAVAAALVAAMPPERRCTLVACGERWSSTVDTDGFRPSIEDWLGAGAIASALGGLGVGLSVEAQMAAALFDATTDLAAVLRASVSGRELIAAGFDEDVELAAALDASPVTVRRTSGDGDRAFVGEPG